MSLEGLPERRGSVFFGLSRRAPGATGKRQQAKRKRKTTAHGNPDHPKGLFAVEKRRTILVGFGILTGPRGATKGALARRLESTPGGGHARLLLDNLAVWNTQRLLDQTPFADEWLGSMDPTEMR